MANNFYGGIALTGGAEGALDRIDGAILNDGDGAIIIDASNDKVYHYTMNAASGAAESSPDTISPDSNAGTKRWILVLVQSFQASWARTIFGSTTLATFLTNAALGLDWIWIPAKAWTPTTTNGCGTLTDYEYVTNDIMVTYLPFDGATEEFATYNWVAPPTWDRSTIKFKNLWIPGTGCSQGDTCEWELGGIAGSDDDGVDTALGTAQVISDTVTAGVEADWHWTGASPAITIGGTPALGDVIQLKMSRNVSGTDDMVEDAWFIGTLLQIGLDQAVSAW